MAGDDKSSDVRVDTSTWFTFGDPRFLDPDINWAGQKFDRFERAIDWLNDRMYRSMIAAELAVDLGSE